nr:MAG TPA: hypothetical protein [Caudoviricetes sp.]
MGSPFSLTDISIPSGISDAVKNQLSSGNSTAPVTS